MESPDQTPRAARAERIGPYFALQLAVARRMAEVAGIGLGEAALTCTNLHRRFGLGHDTTDPPPAWGAFAERLEGLDDPAAQLALVQETFLAAPDEDLPGPGRTAFGCFACDDEVRSDGLVQIHFYNLDTDGDGGPLSAAKLDRRRAEMAALIGHVTATRPQATGIRGRSWLYNLAAYRRVFPPDYGAAARAIGDEPVHLQGNSLWGQAIDSWERVKPDVRDAILDTLPGLDPERPWRIFPMGVMSTSAPMESFRAFYRL